VRAFYRGSDNDLLLNSRVQRIPADPAALAEIDAYYQTTGELSSPLVTLHTVLDQQVPYGHEVMYRLKTLASGSGSRHVNIPVQRYGHCDFTVVDALVAFGVMLNLAGDDGLNPDAVQKLLPDTAAQAELWNMVDRYTNTASQD
jgi:hypothetical protein